MKRIITTITLTFLFIGCSSKEPINKNIEINSIINKDKKHLEQTIGKRNLSDLYSFIYKDNVYSVSQYNKYEFIFKNNNLENVTNKGNIGHLLNINLPENLDSLPFLKQLPLIHQKISNVITYKSKKTKKSVSSSGPSNISDGFAAGTMLIVSIPLLPIFLAAKIQNDIKTKTINWEKDIVGKTSHHLISKLGKPLSTIPLKNGDKILSYSEQYFWVPIYVGIHNNKVLWVSHYNINLHNLIEDKL